MRFLSVVRPLISSSATASSTTRMVLDTVGRSTTSAIGRRSFTVLTPFYDSPFVEASTTSKVKTTRIFMSSYSSSSSPALEEEGSTNKVKFDAELSKIYKIIAENHRHPSGPWVKMLEQVHTYADEVVSKTDIHVLDLATGPGEPAETIARQFPEARVVATDLSPQQISIAQQTTLTLPHMTAQVADMENLVDFNDDTFDVVTCCYGFMFPEDIPRAVKESYRVLKPGGRLIATTWNKVAMMEKVKAIMERVLGSSSPSPPINPLTLAEPGLFESILTDAGYSNLEISTYQYPFDLTKDPEFQFKATTMTMKELLDTIDGGWEKAREAYEIVKYDHGEYDDNGHWILPGSEYKLTVATKSL